MYQSKAALRVAALCQRNSLSTSNCDSWSRSIQARVLQAPSYQNVNAVGLYSSVQNEVGTDILRDHALQTGKRVFYPRLTSTRDLEFVEIGSATELIPGRLGISEPIGKKVLSPCEEVDLLLVVPGVAFDPDGNRLGRGQGWYDRVLRAWGRRATAVGLAYEFQIVDYVPVDRWDQKVRFVVTQDRFIECYKVPEQTEPVC